MEDPDTNTASSKALQSLPDPPTSTPTERVSPASTLRDEEGSEKHRDATPELLQVKAYSPAKVALVTPKYPLTAEELRSIRHPGDTVTTGTRYEVKLIEDGEGRRLFLSQPLPTTDKNPCRETSAPLPQPSEKRKSRQGSILASIDPENIIHKTEYEEERSNISTPPASSIPSSNYSLRNRRAKQGKLVYDEKYHPMDDSIRPSQAAKRRSAHGETILLSDDTIECYSVHDDSDDEEKEDEDETDKAEPKKGSKKRARRRSRSLEPTRRSSRKTATPKISYNMNIHPQDRDLEVSSTDDSDSEAPTNKAKRTKISQSIEEKSAIKSRSHPEVHDMVTISSDTTNIDDGGPPYYSRESSERGEETTLVQEQDTTTKEISPTPLVTTPPPYIRRKEGLDVWLLKPGERYFKHDRDSWPTPGLTFDVYTERLEDQLAAEAKAASPLNFEDDDKENDVFDTVLEETLNLTDGMSVMPASQYRAAQTSNDALSHHSLAAEAFYYTDTVLSPYGMGGSDGAHDQDHDPVSTAQTSETLSIRPTSDQSSCASNVRRPAGSVDPPVGSDSSDSVCGRIERRS